MEQVFAGPAVFCKVNHRPLIGHMTDFKKNIEAHVFDVPFDDIDWEELPVRVNGILVNWKPEGYTKPIELMKCLLARTQTIEG